MRVLFRIRPIPWLLFFAVVPVPFRGLRPVSVTFVSRMGIPCRGGRTGARGPRLLLLLRRLVVLLLVVVLVWRALLVLVMLVRLVLMVVAAMARAVAPAPAASTAWLMVARASTSLVSALTVVALMSVVPRGARLRVTIAAVAATPRVRLLISVGI